MSEFAWLLVAALLIAWAAETIWQRIERRRDEADWQAMVDEAESRAANWHAACRLQEANVNVLRTQLADAETLLVVCAAENERLTDAASRSLPAVPVRTAPTPPADLTKRRAAKAVSKS